MLPRRRRDLLVVGAASLAFAAVLVAAWAVSAEAAAIVGLTAVLATILGTQIQIRRHLRRRARADRRRLRSELRRELKVELRRQRAMIRQRTLRRPQPFLQRQAREQREHVDRAYRQIEALFELHASLETREPLPPMRSWAISPDFANLIVTEVRRKRPRLVVELGSGVSTLICGYLLEELGAGRVVALEHDRPFAEITAERLERHRLAGVANVREAPLRELSLPAGAWRWYDPDALDGLDRIDLLLVDGPPAWLQRLSRYPALPVLGPRLAPDAVILVDDYSVDDVREMVSRWRSEDPGLSLEEVPLEKGGAVLRRSARTNGMEGAECL